MSSLGSYDKYIKWHILCRAVYNKVHDPFRISQAQAFTNKKLMILVASAYNFYPVFTFNSERTTSKFNCLPSLWELRIGDLH